MVREKKDVASCSTAAVNCNVCSDIIVDRKEKSVQCSKCAEWSHAKCTMEDEVFNLLAKINKMKGTSKLVTSGEVAFLCSGCSEFLQTPRASKLSKLQIKSSSAQTVTETLTHADDGNVANANNNSEREDSQQTPAQTAGKVTDPLPSTGSLEKGQKSFVALCSHYKRGRCHHGISG